MSLVMVVSPASRGTRALVTDRREVQLKARPRCPPAHPRALWWRIEAEGATVRGARCAGRPQRTSAASFRAEWLTDFGGPLYSMGARDDEGRR